MRAACATDAIPPSGARSTSCSGVVAHEIIAAGRSGPSAVESCAAMVSRFAGIRITSVSTDRASRVRSAAAPPARWPVTIATELPRQATGLLHLEW